MKITDKRKKPVEFKELAVGDFFEYDDYIWVKYDMEYIENNSLNLDDCVRDSIFPATMVVPVEVELVINR